MAVSSSISSTIWNQIASKGSTPIETHIGDTPLLHFSQITAHLPDSVKIYAKAEWANPGGSVKDRPAQNIIREAELRGELRPGMTILDSTSGNMGIAYAMIGAARGYPVKLILPANASKERMLILRAYGVEIVLSDPADGSDGAIRLVRELYADNPEGYFFANQYNNPDNWQAHYKTTGREIWEQTQGEVTHFVTGLGTSGTLMGTGRRLKDYNADIQLFAFQPDSPFNGLEGLKHMPTAILPGIYDETLADEMLEVETEDAYALCKRLAREEGYLVGISSGAAMAAALRIAEQLEEGVVVTLFPDDASKYLSDPFWNED